MEIQGKIIAVLPPREGTSSSGEWKAQEYVVETHDQYAKKIVFNVYGAVKSNQFSIKIGEEINVSFDIDAHEYNGRWFNSVRAWNIQRVGSTGVQPTQSATTNSQPAQQQSVQQQGQSDDLPF